MKYSTKMWAINKRTLIDDKTMSQIERRLSKTARKYLAERNQIAIEIDGYCFVVCRNQIVLNISGSACSKIEYALFAELAWRSKSAIKAYKSMWSLLHEVGALQ